MEWAPKGLQKVGQRSSPTRLRKGEDEDDDEEGWGQVDASQTLWQHQEQRELEAQKYKEERQQKLQRSGMSSRGNCSYKCTCICCVGE